MTEQELMKLSEIGINIDDFIALEQQGNSTLIQRITLFVEQEHKLRAQYQMIEEQLNFIVQQKNEFYNQLQKHSERY